MRIRKGVANDELLLISRKHESEADFLAMYLLKRAGYDIHTWPEVLSHIDDTNGIDSRLMKMTITAQSDHPLTEDRVKQINEEIPIVEKDFKTKYEVEKKSLAETAVTKPMDMVIDTVLQWSRLLFW